MPDVKRGCLRCKVTDGDIKRGFVVVSPAGIAHHSDNSGGYTDCGADATGDGWFWPL